MKKISIVIITYNRSSDTLELLQNISSLTNAKSLLQDVIIVNNASTESYLDVINYIKANQDIKFYYYVAPSNLGVTKGRNYALQFAKGDTIVFLDDDAILQRQDSLESILKSFEKPGFQDRPVGIVSFKVLYYDGLEMQQNALPHKRYQHYKDSREFFTYFFAGGAHAVKRKALDEVGLLPEEFFYGMEEYDLSYRMIDEGYCIKYDSSIVMLHKESPQGRKPKSEKLRMMWVNKAKVAYRYLPLKYFYSTTVMWSLQYLKATGFNMKGWLDGWRLIFKINSTEERALLQESSIDYLRKVEARLWY